MKTTLLFLSVFLFANMFGQNVYIPDATFKLFLTADPQINTNGDTEIQVSEASAYDGTISCVGLGIYDLTGIEAFTSITELVCHNNSLTSLDVSQNTALFKLECYSNQITSLELSQNHTFSGLWWLRCQNNQLTSLNVSQHTDLLELNCSDNQLTSLDVSQNSYLNYLNCSSNQLTCLNVKNGNPFAIENSDFRVSENSNLFCIQVDLFDYSTTNWTNYLDPQHFFSEDCDYPSDCSLSLTELTTSKNLIQILDLMGRETSFKPNTPLIYVYDDGSIEKVFSVEY